MKKRMITFIAFFTMLVPILARARHCISTWAPASYTEEFEKIYQKGNKIKTLMAYPLSIKQGNARPQEQLKSKRQQLDRMERILNQLDKPYKDEAFANLNFRIRALNRNMK